MFYTHAKLDRADHLRKDAAKQSTLFNSVNAQVLPVWRGKTLIGENADSQPHMLTIPASTSSADEQQRIFLGLVDERPVYAMSISALDESSLTDWIKLAEQENNNSRHIRFEDLRAIGPAMAANEGALMAFARGMIHWHDTCRYCSRCGSELHSIHAGHIKCCSGENCQYQSFPRTDPAVIMLVTREATADSPALCLLGRNAAWPTGVYSTLAGFVETGESLEQAVQREVLEESSISTTNVRYIASQPWPFPRSIMLGFEADATSTEIVCDPDELDDAQWFTVEQLKTFGTWGDEKFEFQLPRPDSIARILIDRWINRQHT